MIEIPFRTVLMFALATKASVRLSEVYKGIERFYRALPNDGKRVYVPVDRNAVWGTLEDNSALFVVKKTGADENESISLDKSFRRDIDLTFIDDVIGHDLDAKVKAALKAAFNWPDASEGLKNPVPVEIERRFLVSPDFVKNGLDAAATEIKEIWQGYPADGDALSVRIRIANTLRHQPPWLALPHPKATLTIKGRPTGPGQMSRMEIEHVVRMSDAKALLACCGKSIVHKTRHVVPCLGRQFEVDVFHGRHAGLVVAEVEIESPDAQVDVPPWCVKEITGDESLSNRSLAKSLGPVAQLVSASGS